jgi:tRNA (guanine37-N1)-methyltransferase
MVLRCEPTVAAIEAVQRPGGRVIALSPRGRRLDQELVRELARETQLVLLCGRYAGFDERILELSAAEEVSIGDYVLQGGELAALVIVETVARLVPGVLGNPLSAQADSLEGGLLEHPLYTRPRVFRGLPVPEVLLSGDHAAIARFRREQSLSLTRRRRPDLLRRAAIDCEERRLLRGTDHD